MPRKYKRKLGSKIRRDYDPNAMENALAAVVDGHLSFRQAGERFSVHFATLYKKYRGIHGDKLGRPPILSVAEENALSDGLLVAASFGYPMTENDIKTFAQGYLNRKGVNIAQFKDNLPGDDWVKLFLQRHPQLSVRASENLKRARASLTVDTLNTYFNELHTSIEGVPPANIINYDESNLTDDPGRQRVIVRRGVKHASRILDFTKSSTSVMFCAAADGTLLPPYIVYRAKNVYPEWVMNGPPGSCYNRSKNGWFDGDIFSDWFHKIAYPYLRRLEGRKIMIGDNLSSHLSLSIINKCVEANIEFKFLPPHSTHICQPLDVSYFRPLKAMWRKQLTKWKLKNKGCLPKSIFPAMLNDCLKMLATKDEVNIKAGFRATGIFPPDRNEVLKKVLGASPNIEQTAMSRSFQEIIENAATVNDKPKVKRSRKINVEAGKSVRPEDFLVETGPSGSNQSNQVDNNVSQENDQDEDQESNPDNFDSESFSNVNDSDIEMDSQEPIKVPFNKTNASQIEVDQFVIVEFTYHCGKKQTIKQFVAKVIDLKKEKIIVSCLRQYMGKKDTFTFPTTEDIVDILLDNIKFILFKPIINRGRYIFKKAVL